jgi:hypothetical protein
MKSAHYLQIFFAVLIGAAGSFAVSEPQYAVAAHAVAAMATSILLALGLASPGVNAPVTPALPEVPHPVTAPPPAEVK